jgi:hypothetical protein
MSANNAATKQLSQAQIDNENYTVRAVGVVCVVCVRCHSLLLAQVDLTDDERHYFAPASHNVVFASAIDRWAFR